MRGVAIVLVAALAAPSLAKEATEQRRYPLPSEYTGWSGKGELPEHGSHGDARWSSLLHRYHSHPCAPAAWTYVEENHAKYPDGEGDRFGPMCVPYIVVVRNDSEGPIQCHIRMELETPDVAGFQTLEMDRVLGPQSTRSVLRTFLRNTRPPKSHSIDCVTLPASRPPDLDLPAECRPEISGPPTASLYPAYAKRWGAEGAVTLEFTLTASGQPEDVRVVETVAIEILADAALYYSKFIRATSPCVGKRARYRVRFADPGG